MPRKTAQTAQTAPAALPFEPLPNPPQGSASRDALTKSVQSVKTEPVQLSYPDAQDVDLVKKTLRAICNDTAAPAAARAQAARTLAEMVHALGRNAAPPPPPSDKPLAQMTRAELEAELARLGG